MYRSDWMKKKIRKEILDQMTQLSPLQRKMWEESLYQQFLDECIQYNIKRVALYYSFAPEVFLQPLIIQLWEKDIEVFLPRMLPQRQMSFHNIFKNKC